MNIIKIIFILMLSVPLMAQDYYETKELNLSGSGIDLLEIECGAGFLKITGIDGKNSIDVIAEIEIENASDEDAKRIIERHMELSLKKRGGAAVLTSRFESGRSFFSMFRNLNVRVNLTIEIPKKIELNINDGSGWIKINSVEGDVFVDDGSGEIEISDIIGNVEIEDGSGAIDLSDISGRIILDDGSGNMDIVNSKGNIKIVDGSGSIRIEEIEGDVNIKDGSGSMTVYAINGSIKIYDGTGSINIDSVEKDVDIREAGSGGVHIRGVKGHVSRPERDRDRDDDDEWYD